MTKQRSLTVAACLLVLIGTSTMSALLAQGANPQPNASSLQRPTGGLQIDIRPRRALVFVDGFPVGRVEEFSGYYRHLTLPAGPHFVEVVEPRFWPMAFTITIVPGRTIKWGAELQEVASTDF